MNLGAGRIDFVTTSPPVPEAFQDQGTAAGKRHGLVLHGKEAEASVEDEGTKKRSRIVAH